MNTKKRQQQQQYLQTSKLLPSKYLRGEIIATSQSNLVLNGNT